MYMLDNDWPDTNQPTITGAEASKVLMTIVYAKPGNVWMFKKSKRPISPVQLFSTIQPTEATKNARK